MFRNATAVTFCSPLGKPVTYTGPTAEFMLARFGAYLKKRRAEAPRTEKQARTRKAKRETRTQRLFCEFCSPQGGYCCVCGGSDCQN